MAKVVSGKRTPRTNAPADSIAGRVAAWFVTSVKAAQRAAKAPAKAKPAKTTPKGDACRRQPGHRPGSSCRGHVDSLVLPTAPE